MRIIRKIKNLLKMLFANKSVKKKYPFINIQSVKEITERDIKFEVNNGIERFRLVQWGDEKEYVLSMINSLNDKDIFLDIGSSVGLISVLAAFKLSKGMVISIETDPENLKCLIRNYQINNLTNYQLINSAAGETKTKMQLFTSGSNGFSPSLKQVNGIESSISVEVNTIDNLVEEGTIPVVPTVVKIDIEGAEMMALKGMHKLLAGSQRPRLLFIELHPKFLGQFGTSVDEIFSFLKNINYDLVERIDRDEQILCKLEAKN